MQKRRNWSNLDLQEEALKYKYKKDFAKNSPSACTIARKRKIFNDICKHMSPLNSLSTKDIYFIVSDLSKEIYIGISCNVHKRYIEHSIRGTKSVRSLLSKQHRLIIIEKNVTIIESLKQENFWIRFFKKRKWKVVNQRPGVSIGLYFNPVWTKEKVLELSQNYLGTISSFKKLYPGAYAHALRNKYHNNLFQKTKSLNLPKSIMFKGKLVTLRELSKIYNLSIGLLNQRNIRGDQDDELIRPKLKRRTQEYLNNLISK